MSEPRVCAGIRDRLVPWAWLPIIFLASLQWEFPWKLSVDLIPPYLLIPIAAMLGSRYQRRGLLVVALGGLILVIGWSYEFVSAGPRIDIYLAAIFVCLLCASSRPLLNVVPIFRPSVGFFAAFAFLPMAVGVYGRLVGNLDIAVVLDFGFLLYLFLFVLGVTNFRRGLLFAVLTVSALTGIALEMAGPMGDGRTLFGGPRAELPILGLTDLSYLWLGYRFDSPANFLAGVAYFLAGSLVGFVLKNRRLGRLTPGHAHGVVFAVAILALGWSLNQWVIRSFTGLNLPPHFRLLGFSPALPLAAFLAGLLLRRHGILTMSLLVLLFWDLNGLIASDFDFSNTTPIFHLHEPLYVLAFGALGVKVRDLALGTETVISSKSWAVYLACLMVALLFVIRPEDPKSLFLLIAFFAAFTAAGAIAAWFRRRNLGPAARHHDGWIALLSLPILGSLVVAYIRSVISLLNQLREETTGAISGISWMGGLLRSEEWPFLITAGLLLFWFGFYVLHALLKYLPDLHCETRQLMRSLATMFSGGIQFSKDLSHREVKNLSSETPLRSVARVKLIDLIGLLRNTTLILATASLVFWLAYKTYPSDGIWNPKSTA
ncbi:hypothetical protein [Devosia sp.]|uniref:hypothetical protein n=1 Tax=Devosia sp. TaxID=1871048 RepID=UPI0027360E80|nr:hypothetical protein [Devosia sp.]MDP2782656.1 hypothetical protein [Devosia sp.]MDZ4346938.1 hypothetical protein [Candidatus Binatia bacterium]